jgi:hypothetical protein
MVRLRRLSHWSRRTLKRREVGLGQGKSTNATQCKKATAVLDSLGPPPSFRLDIVAFEDSGQEFVVGTVRQALHQVPAFTFHVFFQLVELVALRVADHKLLLLTRLDRYVRIVYDCVAAGDEARTLVLA